MKKLVLLLSLLLILMPMMAQESDTIVDIVVASTEAEQPEFTILLSVVQAADPSFLELLAAVELPAGVTVFAPTDDAFDDLLDDMDMDADELLDDTNRLNEILAYHVVPGTFMAEDIAALNGAHIGTALGGYALEIAADEDANVLIGDATVVETDILAANGVVHIIDTVLVPDTDGAMDNFMSEGIGTVDGQLGTIASVLSASSAVYRESVFDILLAALRGADPSVNELLTSPGPWTLFAPNDFAFERALANMRVTPEELVADPERLNEILAYHIVPGSITTAALELLTIDLERDESLQLATLLPGATIEVKNGKINGANIINDIRSGNGVIHVMNEVLLPPVLDVNDDDSGM